MLAIGAQVKEGKVIAVGPGRRANNGELIEPGVKEGDRVLMPDYGGQEVDLDGTKCESPQICPWFAMRQSGSAGPDVTEMLCTA